ncbi:hypothetical protein E2562_011151 [Oryza meyeriana var. granulata]|uniref:Uncharacterized protein n=1 Tax=Oryza meyeriana var. granulata TaxID=110450 RepID=A0A6G1DGJ6_9ORYZ|nr:hypothetical protein E2562_011151 [Oryza meyeriana var. granulata]
MDGAGGSGEPTANGEKKAEEQHFDPSRMIGIIKRKALIKELAAAYHAECVACCKDLLQLQRKWEEVCIHRSLKWNIQCLLLSQHVDSVR